LQWPWKNALIVKLFEKGVGYLQLHKSLATKWNLREDFALIDVGYDY